MIGLRRTTSTAGRGTTLPRGAGGVLALMLLLVVGGCQAGGGAPEMGFPTLNEIASRVTPVLPEDGEQPFADSGSRAWVMVRQADLALSWSMDEAWELMDESVLSGEARRWYRDNGVRMGVLNAGDLEALAERLPAPAAMHQSRVTDAGHPVELRRSPRLSGQVALALPGVDEPEPASGGVMRLLAQLRGEDPGRVSMAVVPHHHLPRQSLMPRDALERELDGRVFEELAARVDLPAGRVLVIGLHHELEFELEDDERDDPAAVLAEAERLADELPANLGRALLTARRAGRPVQVLVMVSAEP